MAGLLKMITKKSDRSSQNNERRKWPIKWGRGRPRETEGPLETSHEKNDQPRWENEGRKRRNVPQCAHRVQTLGHHLLLSARQQSYPFWSRLRLGQQRWTTGCQSDGDEGWHLSRRDWIGLRPDFTSSVIGVYAKQSDRGDGKYNWLSNNRQVWIKRFTHRYFRPVSFNLLTKMPQVWVFG